MRAAVADAPTARGWSPAFELEPAPERGWPLLAKSVPAGFPSPADDRIEGRLSLDAHLARNPETTFLLRVAGDALAGAGIRDGDLLVMDRALPATEGSVVLAIVDHEFLLARLGRDAGGRRVLRAVRPDGGDRLLDDEVVTAGVARWTIHRLWPGRHAPR